MKDSVTQSFQCRTHINYFYRVSLRIGIGIRMRTWSRYFPDDFQWLTDGQVSVLPIPNKFGVARGGRAQVRNFNSGCTRQPAPSNALCHVPLVTLSKFHGKLKAFPAK